MKSVYEELVAAATLAKWVARPNPAVAAIACLIQGKQNQTSSVPCYQSLGTTQALGSAHAEIMALTRFDQEWRTHADTLRAATGGHSSPKITKSLFVTLMPCAFQGHTGACTDAIIQSGVDNVHIAIRDNDPRMHSGTVMNISEKILRDAGISVHYDFPKKLKRTLFSLNEDYFFKQHTGLPFVTVKYAMSLDGNIASGSYDAKWITSLAAREDAMQLRGHCDAVYIGARTLLADNPRLTTRLQAPDDELFQQAYRHSAQSLLHPRPLILFSRDARADEVPKLAQTIAALKLIQDPEAMNLGLPTRREPPICLIAQEFTRLATILKNHPVIVHHIDQNILRDGNAFRAHIKELGECYHLNSIFVEGGAHTTSLFKASGLMHRMVVYIAPKILAQQHIKNWIAAPPIPPFAPLPIKSFLEASSHEAEAHPFQALRETSFKTIGDDLRMYGYLDDASVREKLWHKLS